MTDVKNLTDETISGGVIKYNPDEIQNGAVEISLGHKEVLLVDNN